jgi:6-phosphogluconate dehydrogenase
VFSKNGSQISVSELKKAYMFAKIVNHQQGFEIIKQASNTYQRIDASEDEFFHKN